MGADMRTKNYSATRGKERVLRTQKMSHKGARIYEPKTIPRHLGRKGCSAPKRCRI